MSKERKDIQRARMWRYFLDAATEIIEEEGINNMTIRKIANRAGFTGSTAYNYFKDLSHLKFFAAMRFTSDYVNELPGYMEKGTNTVEKWLYSWECFCKHSFEQPEIYSVIFMDNLGGEAEQLFTDYYAVYKDDLTGLPEHLRSIITEHNFAKRSALFIESAVDEGFMNEDDVELLADITLMIWKGMINTYINKRRAYTKEEAVERTLLLVKESVLSFINENRKKEIIFGRY